MQHRGLKTICRAGGIIQRLSIRQESYGHRYTGRDAAAAVWRTVGNQNGGYCSRPSEKWQWLNKGRVMQMQRREGLERDPKGRKDDLVMDG